MAKNFSALKAALPPKAQAKVTQKMDQMLQGISLQELPKERDLSQNNDGKSTVYSATRRGEN